MGSYTQSEPSSQNPYSTRTDIVEGTLIVPLLGLEFRENRALGFGLEAQSSNIRSTPRDSAAEPKSQVAQGQLGHGYPS